MHIKAREQVRQNDQFLKLMQPHTRVIKYQINPTKVNKIYEIKQIGNVLHLAERIHNAFVEINTIFPVHVTCVKRNVTYHQEYIKKQGNLHNVPYTMYTPKKPSNFYSTKSYILVLFELSFVNSTTANLSENL